MNEYDDGAPQESFLDHLFNAVGHLARAQRRAQAQRQQAAEVAPPSRRGKRVRLAGFDEAPVPASDCCTAKRE